MSGFTKDIIARTLIELLDEKPMSKVTVKDIVERCGVNRNTFYYHFHDIPEVVEYVLKRKWDEILNSPRESNSILECMEEMADIVKANRRMMLNVYRSVKRDAFLYYMNEVSGYVFTRYFEKNTERLEIDDHERMLLIKYYKCLYIGLLMDWLDQGMTDDLSEQIQDMAELMEKRKDLLHNLNN